jgi:predicted lipoprotein with Yx(FWY)xxD motif
MNAPASGGPTIPSHQCGERRRRPLGLRRHVGLLGRHPDLALLAGVGAALVLLSACGSTAAGSGGSSPSSGPVVKVGMASVNGSSEQVVTESDGWTLYYNTHDTSTTSSCTGACAGTWPPLLDSGQPTSASSLSGTLTTASTGNGNQVEYEGHPLYKYSGDSAADQANGEGADGIWFVVTPDLGSGSAASPSAAASSSAAYGY